MRCISQQPLKEDTLPGYLFPDPDSTLRPPVMRYGWRVDHKKVMGIVMNKFPEAVVHTTGPDAFGEDNGVDYDDEEYHRMTPDTCSTLIGVGLRLAVCKYFHITDRSLFRITSFYDEMGNDYFGVSIGTNFQGTIEPWQQDGIQALLAENVQPMWYLDPQYWHWRRICKKQTLRHPQRETVAVSSRAIPRTQQNVSKIIARQF